MFFLPESAQEEGKECLQNVEACGSKFGGGALAVHEHIEPPKPEHCGETEPSFVAFCTEVLVSLSFPPKVDEECTEIATTTNKAVDEDGTARSDDVGEKNFFSTEPLLHDDAYSKSPKRARFEAAGVSIKTETPNEDPCHLKKENIENSGGGGFEAHGSSSCSELQAATNFGLNLLSFSSLSAVCSGKEGSVMHCKTNKTNNELGDIPARPLKKQKVHQSEKNSSTDENLIWC